MNQVPLEIWNAISPKFDWVGKLAAITDELEFQEACTGLIESWVSDGVDPLVASIYLSLAPLYLARSEISEWISITGNSDLRNALPELLVRSDFIEIVGLEHPYIDGNTMGGLIELLDKDELFGK